MKEHIRLKATFRTTPEKLYNAWLDSNAHSAMTGGEAFCSANINETFSAWDEYITGKNVALEPHKKIVQTWRTTEFESKDEDSILTIELKAIDNGTELTLTHTHIPEGQTHYKNGWEEHYFEPMQNYFENSL